MRAKRALLARGRSLSLASFRLPHRLKLRPDRDNKQQLQSSKPKYYEKELCEPAPPRGELDFLKMEQLINLSDIGQE